MERDRNKMADRIINLTLQILFRLTGEDYTVVKKSSSGRCRAPVCEGWGRTLSPIPGPPPHSLIHEEMDEQKILELINKMMELLTGEVPIRCQDVAVYFSMEEWEYVEGHKDQYKDQVIMEDQQPLTSPDGVMDRNPPERCPRSLDSQDCPEGNVPENHQGGDLTNNKVEDEEERMMGDHPCMREVKEEIPGSVTPENPSDNTWGDFIFSPNSKVEDEEITPHSSGDNLFTHNAHPGLYGTDLLYYNPPNHEEPSSYQPQIGPTKTDPKNVKSFYCDVCGRDFTKRSALVRHKKSHTGEKMYSCSESGKCFTSKRHGGLYWDLVMMEDQYKDQVMMEDQYKDQVMMEDQYKDQVIMEDQQPLTSPDGVMDRNPPERCPRPLYSQDCPEGNVPENHQGGDLTNIKVEDEEERIMDHHPCMREVKEEIPGGVTPENSSKIVWENFMLFPNFKVEDEDVTPHSSGENMLSLNAHPGAYSTDLLYYNPPNHEEPSSYQSQMYPTKTDPKNSQSFYSDAFGRLFTKRPAYVRYRKSQAGEKLYSCAECGKCFKSKLSFVKHERTHTRENPFSCLECGKCFTSKSDFVMHERIHRGEKPYSCSECGKCFHTKAYLVLHEKRHRGENSYTCSECGKHFTSKSDVIKHERIHTGEKPYSCSECGKCFAQKSYVVIHARIHRGEKPYSCTECGKGFAHKSNLIKHVRGHTGEKPYACSECEKRFQRKSHLVSHERIHTGVKPFSCSKCAKCFTSRSTLVKHERIHTGEKPYSCSECGKCLTSKATLAKHERIHTGENPFSCSECGKCLSSKSNLIKHERIHTGEKPFSCSECGKCLTSKANLIKHERIHTGEKPYSCAECGKRLTSKANLIKHQKIHTGTKPFSCPECGKSFKRKSHLVSHKRSHTVAKPYSCPECGKCFINQSQLSEHEKIHTEDR
ncbi:zinc finger protein 432-like isoform X1 [Hyla sarda]|uniref:zinc finger protein 432-like isoform X1 n=1 Tax=Hyla sarda TaxID=327740 RepID=UPI0024C21BC2|nr:zinc finger protein 432-like isoform X1 [Hyla sarda]